MAQIRGTARWFNDGKGFGLIDGEDGVVYNAHFSQIFGPGTGFRSLDAGEKVRFLAVPESAKNPRAQAREVRRERERPPLNGAVIPSRWEKSPRALRLEVDAEGNISLPQFNSPCELDYFSGDRRAYYLGHAGYYPTKQMQPVEVELPKAVASRNIAVAATNFDGYILRRRFHPDLRHGDFVLVVKVEGSRIFAEAKKIGVRRQDSSQGLILDKYPQDIGVWLTLESPFKQGIDTSGMPWPPSPASEEFFINWIREQIPDPEGWSPMKRGASFKKFAEAIAELVYEITDKIEEADQRGTAA